MSNKKRTNKKRRRSPWYKIFAKTETRLSARVTCEEDWQTDVPNIRLSRAFVIVLLMHLVVGGALVAFTLMNPGDANGQAKADASEKKAEKLADNAKESATASDGASVTTPTNRTDDMRRHIVHSGDSVAKIAEQYGVTSAEIHDVNRIDELYQLYQGRVLRIPVSVSTPVPLDSAIAERPSTNGSNEVKRGLPTHIPPTVQQAEIPIPGEIDPAPENHPTRLPLLPESLTEVSRPVVEEAAESPAETDRDTAIVRPSELPAAPPAPPVLPTAQQSYTVVKGDTAFGIAKKFGVHYKELLRHNGITDPSKLQIGKTLRIPN